MKNAKDVVIREEEVTGIRKDPWANVHRIEVEEDTPPEEQGYYLYPDLYGKAAENGISRLLFPTEEEKQELLINENKP
jgi:Fe-S cluster biosynthesis and repair protein YggX